MKHGFEGYKRGDIFWLTYLTTPKVLNYKYSNLPYRTKERSIFFLCILYRSRTISLFFEYALHYNNGKVLIALRQAQ